MMQLLKRNKKINYFFMNLILTLTIDDVLFLVKNIYKGTIINSKNHFLLFSIR